MRGGDMRGRDKRQPMPSCLRPCCIFCRRTFGSPHALAVHLARNVACKAAARARSVYREHIPYIYAFTYILYYYMSLLLRHTVVKTYRARSVYREHIP